MIATPSDFEKIVEISERVAWRVDDVIRADERLDFTKAFLPEEMAATRPLTFLSAGEQLRLNQIRANAYLHLFTFVEETIIPMALRHATAELFGDPWAIRALARFADEEVKHQQLFQRFAAAFARDFGSPCGTVSNAEEAAGFILQRSPLAVLLVTLHLELITQAHYVDSVRVLADANELEPLFASMLKHHWVEEAQHAKIDALEIRKLGAHASGERVAIAIAEYEDILRTLDTVLRKQSALDLQSLELCLGRDLSANERQRFEAVQTASYADSFLFAGLKHRAFRAEIGALHADSGALLDAIALRLRGPT